MLLGFDEMIILFIQIFTLKYTSQTHEKIYK